MPLDQVGGVCVPDSATVRAGGYETRGFGVGFSGASTGSIRLLCLFTVTGNMLDVNIGLIFMSVIDGDGMNTGARVRLIERTDPKVNAEFLGVGARRPKLRWRSKPLDEITDRVTRVTRWSGRLRRL